MDFFDLDFSRVKSKVTHRIYLINDLELNMFFSIASLNQTRIRE